MKIMCIKGDEAVASHFRLVFVRTCYKHFSNFVASEFLFVNEMKTKFAEYVLHKCVYI